MPRFLQDLGRLAISDSGPCEVPVDCGVSAVSECDREAGAADASHHEVVAGGHVLSSYAYARQAAVDAAQRSGASEERLVERDRLGTSPARDAAHALLLPPLEGGLVAQLIDQDVLSDVVAS